MDGAPAAAPRRRPARLPDGHPPALLVVLDAEEDFDWSAPFRREHAGVASLAELPRAQAVFDAYRVRPTYVVTHAVAERPDEAAPLREILASGRGVIGAHVHPWVTPPYDEELGPRHSFPGNLPRALEAAKLARTCAAIERAFGQRPRVHQAGRYGLGPHTEGILREQGFLFDTSILPAFDYSAEGGPDFSREDGGARWIECEAAGALLSLPQTAGYVGWLAGDGTGGRARALHRLATHPLARTLRAAGLLSRLRALERLRLSPEGYAHDDHRRLVRALLARGQRVFTLSFHTPSLKPGCTPYVHSTAERDALLDRCRRLFDWFLGDLGGVALTPLELRERMLSAEGGAAATHGEGAAGGEAAASGEGAAAASGDGGAPRRPASDSRHEPRAEPRAR